ncbi:hypothetical protein [Microcoleus sp. CAWBG58]|uniref:hypothetical protein n=1 Tax=Microcoleus sp. CAWBG58 TaxID=2841651 RepID=UPI0025D28889|nr:hypothetical protein [Microcoleus sp. CAWBG58]
MITEDTRIDYERVGDIIPPSVSTVLFEVFGSDFSRADRDELLILLEVVALSLRQEGAFCDSLREVVGSDMPCGIYTHAAIGKNEGLKLLAILQVAIVESYSVLAVNQRLAN